MTEKKQKPIADLKPYSYQPSKAELEELIYVSAPDPQTLARAVMVGGVRRKESE